MAILHTTTNLLLWRRGAHTEGRAIMTTTVSTLGRRAGHSKTPERRQKSLSRTRDVGTIVVPALLSISSATSLLEMLLSQAIDHNIGRGLFAYSTNSSLYKVSKHSAYTKSGRGLFETWEGGGVMMTSCRRGVAAKKMQVVRCSV
jgi:hypothetical protein